MRVIGLLCGSGNLLREAQDQGYRVVGNIDPRPYYRQARWVWESNFDAPMYDDKENDLLRSLEESSLAGAQFLDDDWYDAELAIGHPPCGGFSMLGMGSAPVDRMTKEEREAWDYARSHHPGMLPLFCQMVNEFRPRIFAMDNLPKMLKAFPKSWWKSMLPDYRITVITIWNWPSGSPQRRERAWIVGCLRKKRFEFREPKKRLAGPTSLWEAIRDLPWEPWKDIHEIDHVHHDPANEAMGSFPVLGDTPMTDYAPYVSDTAMGYLSIAPGRAWPYKTAVGRFTGKFAHCRLTMDRPARTLSKSETLRHPITGWPLTPRERGRLMGWPDDFHLIGQDMEPNQSVLRALSMITGKAVPNEFVRYLIPQLTDHVFRRNGR
jgi:site-specific DNA-cytosine methylase